MLSIENSKSDAKLLKVFIDEAYPATSALVSTTSTAPRVPSEQEIKDRIWRRCCSTSSLTSCGSNPDCGLKTRQWKETKEALKNMVNAAQYFRQKYNK